MLRIVLLCFALLLPLNAIAAECVVIDGEKFCKAEQKSEITLGGVTLKVKDPAELLRKAKQTRGGLKKTGLYDDYHLLPVIEELARQNDMGYHEFITFMIERWESEDVNPFRTIRSFELVYEEIPQAYKQTVIDGIAWRIADDIEKSIIEVFGEIENA